MPHLAPQFGDAGILQVTCGHCGVQFLTDTDGHAEHRCGGCCADHLDMQNEENDGDI